MYMTMKHEGNKIVLTVVHYRYRVRHYDLHLLMGLDSLRRLIQALQMIIHMFQSVAATRQFLIKCGLIVVMLSLAKDRVLQVIF